MGRRDAGADISSGRSQKHDELADDLLASAAFRAATSGMWVASGVDDPDVGVALSDAGMFVGWLDVVWCLNHQPTWCLKRVTHLPWECLEGNLATASADFERAVKTARSARARALRRCRFCSERFVPGHMHSPDVCQGCAERKLGVVY